MNVRMRTRTFFTSQHTTPTQLRSKSQKTKICVEEKTSVAESSHLYLVEVSSPERCRSNITLYPEIFDSRKFHVRNWIDEIEKIEIKWKSTSINLSQADTAYTLNKSRKHLIRWIGGWECETCARFLCQEKSNSE